MLTLGSDICKIIFAVILPPLGVFLEVGCGTQLLLNILLTILGVSYHPAISFQFDRHLAQQQPG
ncbi:hypothetical protein BT67DRAFT_439264 [Trichocladium antarcticum]|uniref:Plasma membrane proteolipid 3 n=1 Tax=Trichocladium antarcticum TaxID=1450529 RepID=A0AAN6URU8_9PEZI|nr:hypothetical protein BT67DRAFT_439264 [Trichocladium antarcticum]